MRRSTMISGIERVLATLDSSGLSDLLSATARTGGTAPKKRPDPADTLRRFHEFASNSGGFSTDELQVLGAFELEPLLDTATWLAFVSEDGPGAAQQRSLGYKYRSFRAYAPKFLSMVENEGQKVLKNPPAKREAITLILPVEAGQFSSASRVVTAVTAMEKLYSTCAHLAGVSDSELQVVAFDSGQDLSVDFMGHSAAIAPFREMLHSIWDRVVLHRDLNSSERERVVVDTLPVHLAIAKQAEEGAIDREAAERLKRQVTSGAREFIAAGCMLEEFETNEHGGPRVLMAPSKRLIEGPIDELPGLPGFSTPKLGKLGKLGKSDKSKKSEPEIEIVVEA